MKTNRIIYWATTGIIAMMMTFSAYSYLTNPQMDAAFTHLGFPSYFRIELAIAKIIGAIVLLVPQIPARIKEWAYAGFSFVFISAIIAHLASNDPVSMVIGPFIALVLLSISYVYFHKLNVAVT
jgi:hypothetical protein